jgi:amino acid transporter
MNTVLYIFFKFFLKSKVVPVKEMDLQTEFQSIEQEKEYWLHNSQEDAERLWWKRLIHLISISMQ